MSSFTTPGKHISLLQLIPIVKRGTLFVAMIFSLKTGHPGWRPSDL